LKIGKASGALPGACSVERPLRPNISRIFLGLDDKVPEFYFDFKTGQGIPIRSHNQNGYQNVLSPKQFKTEKSSLKSVIELNIQKL